MLGKHVRACCGVHAYQAHRTDVMISRIIESAAMRIKMCGQGLVEYALIMALVAVVVMVILALLGPAVGNVFSGIVSSI